MRARRASWPNAPRRSRACSRSIRRRRRRRRIDRTDGGAGRRHRQRRARHPSARRRRGRRHRHRRCRTCCMTTTSIVSATARRSPPPFERRRRTAEIFAIKVFDRELAATGVALVAAFERAHRARCSHHQLEPGHAERRSRSVAGERRARRQGRGRDRGGRGRAGRRALAARRSRRRVGRCSLDWSVPREECRVTLRSEQRAGVSRVRVSAADSRRAAGEKPERPELRRRERDGIDRRHAVTHRCLIGVESVA